MSEFNLSYIMNRNNLEPNALANLLFSNNKYPRMALERVLSGKMNLDTEQLKILANVLSIHISELFDNATWIKKESKDLITLTKGKFKVEVDTNTFVSTIYSNDLKTSEVIISKKNILLSEFLKELDELLIQI